MKNYKIPNEIANTIRSSEKYQNEDKNDNKYNNISEILESFNHFV